MNDLDVFYPLKGFEGSYEITKNGVIRSIDRVITMKNGVKKSLKGKVLITKPNNKGYIKVALGIVDKRMFLHRLLAFTFLPNPHNYPIINHIDNNPLNNELSNLEWCNQSHNMRHKIKSGYKNPNRKLTEEAVIDIYLNAKKSSQPKKGFKITKGNVKDFCKKYNVHRMVICNILNEVSYPEIINKLK